MQKRILKKVSASGTFLNIFLYWLKILIVSDVSAKTVAFFSKDKKCKCLTASCEVIGSFSIDDGNCNDNATNQKFDWSSEEK